MDNNNDYGTYYQPQVDNAQPAPKGHKGIVAIIITLIVCFTVVASVGIVCAYHFFSGTVGPNISGILESV